jgi:hypothetical protein
MTAQPGAQLIASAELLSNGTSQGFMRTMPFALGVFHAFETRGVNDRGGV